VHAFETVEWIELGHPDGVCTVWFLLDVDVGGEKGAGAVVLGPVKLNTAGNPWASKSYEGGFDHILSVEKIVVVVGFILTFKNPATNLGKHHQADKFIF